MSRFVEFMDYFWKQRLKYSSRILKFILSQMKRPTPPLGLISRHPDIYWWYPGNFKHVLINTYSSENLTDSNYIKANFIALKVAQGYRTNSSSRKDLCNSAEKEVTILCNELTSYHWSDFTRFVMTTMLLSALKWTVFICNVVVSILA